ncbi:TetR/AcrR family transcriptional regulator [Isoptericola variabilis]|uniref:Regulatory protein TetR n=1 Tax=Isoptericola variabilis (strain 225) TaxID=743718 RepID=F6FS79_ISOV2|nr:TetR family transcriptional regulator [Isoptericola variabilis]AEG43020.1 regulatory protein TetR [Isoptericola variabilis 225]TWH30129.1 TetR family transcriptional regulator [Isoptericola variabilis J7]
MNVRSADDLTTRARIRDAAVLRFARSGFDATVRDIAADAGVSPALVIHHFGSKAKLHAVCDEHVLAWIAESKRKNMGPATSGRLMEVLTEAEEFAPLLGYVLRSLQAGGEVAAAFVNHMIEDAEKYTAEAVRAGIVKPSLDEAKRVRFLVLSSLGSMLLALTLDPPQDPADLQGTLRRFLKDQYLPQVELFTQGFLTNRRMLDDYLLYVGDPPSSDRVDADVPSEDDPAA